QATASSRWRTAAEHLPEDVPEATASGHRPATPICEHREHHRQGCRHDVRLATAGCGRALARTLTPLLTKAPTQSTAEQIVEKSPAPAPLEANRPTYGMSSRPSRIERGGGLSRLHTRRGPGAYRIRRARRESRLSLLCTPSVAR